MKLTLHCIGIFVVAAALSAPASAITLSLTPANAFVSTGQVVSLDLVIADLGNAQAPSAGDFDIDLTFNTGDLSFVNYTLGNGLGDLGLTEALDVSFGLYAAGTINIAELSLLGPSILDANQPDTFVLATLQFMVTGLAPGNITTIDIATVFALGDATGSALAVDSVSGSQLTATVIPLPAGLWLLSSALLLSGLRRTKR